MYVSEMPEMFYVQIKPCPVGFTLQSDKNLVIVIQYYYTMMFCPLHHVT